MTIAQVVPTFPPYRGGMGQVAHEYTSRLRERGHDVQVFTAWRADSRDRGDGGPGGVHRLRTPVRFGNAAFLPALYRRLQGFDVVHLHYPFFGGAEPVVLRRLLHRRQALVVTYQMDAVAAGLKGGLFRLHDRCVLPVLLARADRVLVSSLDYAEHSALARVPGVLSRVDVHPLGVDLARFHPGQEPDLRSSLGIGPSEPVLIFVARLDAAHDFKGLPVLLDALREMRGLSWRLLVVGDGPLRPSLEHACAARGLAARVHFAGDVDDAVLPAYYRLADIHVLPSTSRSEAFGLVCLEAAATGMPTIASQLPGVRSVVRDGETGLLVPPNDAAGLAEAIRRLLEQPDIRDRLGHAARARAELEYSWDPLVTRLEQTYRACFPPAVLPSANDWDER